MKTYQRIIKTVTILFVAVSCSGLDGDRNTIVPDLSPDLSSLGLTKAHEEIAASQMDFGVNIFKALANQQEEMDNLLVSPFSLSLDLSMLASGAEGETYEELVRGLGFEGYTTEQLGEYYSGIINANYADSSTTFEIANALWINTGNAAKIKVKETYVDEVSDLYRSSVEALDFHDNNMVDIINQWGRNNTHGYVDPVLAEKDAPSPDYTLLMLTNALYFSGNWSVGLRNGAYQEKTKRFYNLDGSLSAPKFFYGTNNFYSEYNTAWDNSEEPAILTLSYGDHHFKMMIIVPPKDKNFKAFVSSLSASDIINWKKKSHREDAEKKITFYVPQFKETVALTHSMMRDALKEVGISKIYDPGGLTKISDNPSLSVDKVLQKASIEVDKEGTTAAAVTVIQAGFTAFPHSYKREYDFVVDRPFVYAIVDDFNSILFMGMVTNLKGQ